MADRNIRLHLEVTTMAWLEFRDLVHGLLCADTRLYRHFAELKKREG